MTEAPRDFVLRVKALPRAEIAELIAARDAHFYQIGIEFERSNWARLTLRDAKARLTRIVVERCGFNRACAAKALGITQRTLYRAKWLDP